MIRLALALTLALALLGLAAPAALAEGGGFGPYAPNPTLTRGRLEGFRELYVAADALDSLSPARALPPEGDAPPPAGIGDLQLINRTNAFTDVEIAGVKVGRVGPLTTAVIHDLPAGVYDVRFTAPNGLSVVRALEVRPVVIKRTTEVTPEPLLIGSPPPIPTPPSPPPPPAP
ncbi:hypothetical protein L6R49_19260 [Myxococcota bacterium]|nr:hypothetical protein [Myxococcota bacterium]